ncbi:ferritin-like domain-containing protein [Candidatus Hecatella orcuttiae]|jgi:rubrerythrin|uniref:ferritin-like domain-containing protein n=1 Tax=Candidatus Hecatella orcuttiae TaxID=1935119 RepID=UPI002867BA3B|nr:ferritin-like domain-containing protein [Candidatus Hecatella orcuttiae]
MENLLGKLRKQEEFERVNAEFLSQTVAKMKNIVVKLLLHGIALDSLKHSDILNALIGLFSEPTALSDDERNMLEENLQKHIEFEEKMLNEYAEIVEETENKEVKFLLEYILSDEKRHHQTIKEIMEQIVNRETITEEDWWEILYKDAVSHGAPSG